MADETDSEADKADALLAEALEITKENSETCVERMIAPLWMVGDPMTRLTQLGLQAAEALETAKRMDPEIPSFIYWKRRINFLLPTIRRE